MSVFELFISVVTDRSFIIVLIIALFLFPTIFLAASLKPGKTPIPPVQNQRKRAGQGQKKTTESVEKVAVARGDEA